MSSPSCDEVADELQVIESIFCQSGEFVLHDFNALTGSSRYTIAVSDVPGNSLSPLVGSTLAITFTTTQCYPQSLPVISLTSDLLTRKATDSMKSDLVEYANEHLRGEPMTLEIVEWVRLHFKEYANEDQTLNQPHVVSDRQGGLKVSLLRLDHMRAKARYVKTITSWCAELGIVGRIFFVEKLILILLEGHQDNVKDFILRLKTQKVDVDSNGKGCKEKMMSVLSERHADEEKSSFSSFEVAELESIQSLKKTFDAVNLRELFEEHIQPLCRHPMQGSIR
ncbi:RWD domain-containing protein 3-like [Strongylocentrotus purpuratus]|uniref:RWD domain-containing protein 3 n=1 Tax=Strongylocentrotus purpuratus TaxID=7668 RepID=A0A7M7LWF6_STRPU|nr:RWD domain-containing protein 3-like [Strongylocentrotus purpuratus]|eukprot:XP_011678718.1 PREDICTED: RWD domain-containing protein 3-like [Strongylocentrotus purpuratus]